MSKRKGENHEKHDTKKAKKSRQLDHADQLTPFAVGIFVTCVRGKEKIAQQDILQLLEEHEGEQAETGTNRADVEQSIENELSALQAQARKKETGFTPLKTNTECVLFIKTAKSIDPVQLVHEICTKALSNKIKYGGRFIRRMTPISASAEASLPGLLNCLSQVLPAKFTDIPRRYRVEPTFRNHNVLTRDLIIPEAAKAISALGHHIVDLTGYDVLVLVEVNRGFLGVSVVEDWLRLKKYNLSEIYTSQQTDVVP